MRLGRRAIPCRGAAAARLVLGPKRRGGAPAARSSAASDSRARGAWFSARAGPCRAESARKVMAAPARRLEMRTCDVVILAAPCFGPSATRLALLLRADASPWGWPGKCRDLPQNIGNALRA